MIICTGSGSGNTNSLFNLISQQPDIDKIDLYAKDPDEAKHQFLINKPFIEYSNDMDGIYKIFEEDNSNRKRKILIVFYGMTGDMLNNKKT